ncbi:MAG TPA: class I SAM-dependent methyltransferase, partial [Longimicrobiales bacterium]|nr:class I SAM-dependent methyltransferase [Longimicrobiales bacterium]
EEGPLATKLGRQSVSGGAVGSPVSDSDPLAERVREMVQSTLAELPWKVRVQDWTGARWDAGGDAPHWSGHEALELEITPGAGRDLLGLNAMRFLERFVDGEADMEGNLYLLADIRSHARLTLKPWDVVRSRLRNRVMESPSRARDSVTSHYDIPEEALFYLDRAYRSYSCAMFEDPADLAREGLLRVGQGEGDDWDSLEKAQWRKFAHAADYLAPGPEETVLDVGCGYPGFLKVLMDRHRCRNVVGWTHSANQVREGREMLADYDRERYELRQGDYREDDRVYDHIHSTGMISHVGPPGRDSGLVNYVRHVRRRIRDGGRYVHHSLMTGWQDRPLFDRVGPAFNRRYVWPGFFWYTLGDHVKALEENGFQVAHIINLSPHYAKTTRAWYERLLADRETFIRHAGEATFRAWRVFLAGTTAGFLNRSVHCYRLLCEAVDPESSSPEVSEPAANAAARFGFAAMAPPR